MVLRKQILTENDCYRKGEYINVIGVMLHTTGANNPTLRRYIGPDDGYLGYNPNGNHWNMPGVGACVHAFIGEAKDSSVACYQTLPWDMRGWHCGKGPNGSANNTHIGIEICEDDLLDRAYFLQVYRAAVELTAMLCREKHLDPTAPGVVIDHVEGRKLGIASNHADVSHWFSLHSKSMDTFRADVARVMKEEETVLRYNTIDEIKQAAPWAAPTIRKMIDKGYLAGNGKKDANGDPADLDLSMDMIRLMVMNDAAGLYGK